MGTHTSSAAKIFAKDFVNRHPDLAQAIHDEVLSRSNQNIANLKAKMYGPSNVSSDDNATIYSQSGISDFKKRMYSQSSISDLKEKMYGHNISSEDNVTMHGPNSASRNDDTAQQRTQIERNQSTHTQHVPDHIYEMEFDALLVHYGQCSTEWFKDYIERGHGFDLHDLLDVRASLPGIVGSMLFMYGAEEAYDKWMENIHIEGEDEHTYNTPAQAAAAVILRNLRDNKVAQNDLGKLKQQLEEQENAQQAPEPIQHFSNCREMLDCLANHQDLYNPRLNLYLHLRNYNANGILKVFNSLTPDLANECKHYSCWMEKLRHFDSNFSYYGDDESFDDPGISEKMNFLSKVYDKNGWIIVGKRLSAKRNWLVTGTDVHGQVYNEIHHADLNELSQYFKRQLASIYGGSLIVKQTDNELDIWDGLDIWNGRSIKRNLIHVQELDSVRRVSYTEYAE